ncbi:hypothetical protein FIV42_24590 [Persicimonas caeni]|uniref:Uncharacterized protein n=1 Tax=Persicimonas caeni TaxID=2292766 RepID=A0A4Y6Q1E3_PERCE|nr:hypothetical protein [Persicimonas caeni]QDG53805.1 hypothetical protein FIV42_24590 [Persicimonas caeni]QED35026.1 hypothetical protein FRD00_24585 [Persicimonas caeni]
MPTNNETNRREFERKVALLVSEYAVSLSPEEMSEALESIVHQLTHPGQSHPGQSHPGQSHPNKPQPAAPARSLEDAPSTDEDPSTLEYLHSVDLRAGRGVVDWTFHLDETTLDEVLVTLASRDGWGIVELGGDDVQIQLLIGRGKLYDVEFHPPRESKSLHAYLRSKELISEADANLLVRDAHARSVTEAQVLLSHPHILDRRQAASAVLSHVASVAGRLDGQSFDGGRYFELSSPYRGQTLAGVDLHRLVFMRAKYRAKRNPEQTKQALVIGELRRTDFASFSPDTLGLSLSERQLLDGLLDTPRRLDHILKACPLPPARAMATLAGFDAVGLLDRSSSKVKDTAGWARRTHLTESRIDALYDKTHTTDDPFAVLGLHWSCYDAEVERRYRYLRDLLSRTNLPTRLPPDKIKRVRQIRSRIDAAHKHLREPKTRKPCREKFAPASKRKDVRDALEKLAGDAMRQQKFVSALDFYQRLLELDPTHEHAGKMLPTLITRVNQG